MYSVGASALWARSRALILASSADTSVLKALIPASGPSTWFLSEPNSVELSLSSFTPAATSSFHFLVFACWSCAALAWAWARAFSAWIAASLLSMRVCMPRAAAVADLSRVRV